LVGPCYADQNEEFPVPETKLVVIYPRPLDAARFDHDYNDAHVPLAVDKLTGAATRIAVTKINGSAAGDSPYYLMAEAYFPSGASLEGFLGSPDGQELAQHAVSISSGGAPLFLVSEETQYPL
jgi:uncharacterized protein (TIGR02118 family)